MLVSKPTSGRRTILPIQYLRGVAALLVVWFHAKGQVPGVDALIAGTAGANGVDLFFVISGFIMVVTTTGSTLTPAEFFRRRLIRVAPLYWMLTLLMVGVALLRPELFKTLVVAPTTLVQSLLFIPHYSESFPNKIYPLLVPGWTLDMEMFFYALFALSLFLQARVRLVALGVTFLLLIAAGFAFAPISSAIARTYTSPLLLEFAAGAVIGHAWLRGSLRISPTVSCVFIVIGAALLVSRDVALLYHSTQMLGAAIVVIGALHERFEQWDSTVLRALGDSSYSLYLSHVFTLGVLREAWTAIHPTTSTVGAAMLFMLVSCTVCAVVGYLSYRWLETPLSSLLNRRPKASARIAPDPARPA